jgi:acylglycerol lipase
VSDPGEPQGTFRGVGGGQIYWRSWPVPDGPRAAIVIAHGFGEHSGRYEAVAERLQSDGYAVFALDHQGHGRSSGPRGSISMPTAVADLDQLVLLARDRHPDADVFLLGHSMGGAIAIRYAIAHGDRLTGLILSAPVAQVDASAPLKLIAHVLAAVTPRLPVSKIDARTVSRDPAVVAAYRFDPLVFALVPAVTADMLIRHSDSLAGDIGAVALPTLLMWGTEDRLCPPAGSELIARRIGSSDLTATAYDGLYHEIFNEPEREQVLAGLLDWLAARVPAPHHGSRAGD